MSAIREFFKGKKTYLTCLAAVVAVLIAWSEGAIPDGEAIKDIVMAIVAIFVRAGVTTEINK